MALRRASIGSDADEFLARPRADVATLQPGTTIAPDNLLHALDHWERNARASAEKDRANAVAVDHESRPEAIERTALVDSHIKFLASSFDKSTAYTNIVLLAGHATCFGHGSLVKDLVSPANRWWILCMLASVALFVTFEL